MSLYEQITSIYTDLTILDFSPRGTIVIQNDNDGKGDYIKSWNHPTHPQPTEAQLQATGK
jgi:hypothetical protein